MSASRQIRVGDAFFRRCPISTLKAVDVEKATVDAMVSTVNPDRYREIVVPSAFTRRLESYRRNPMHLWAHDPRQLENVIGKAIEVAAVKGGFVARFQYAIDENPRAKMAFDMIRSGYLNAYSVGFYVHSWIKPQELEKFPDIARELEGLDLSEVEVIFVDVELFEISLCAVPANRESLVVGRAAEEVPSGTVMTGSPEDLASALAILFERLTKQRKELNAVSTPPQRIAPEVRAKLEETAAGLGVDPDRLQSIVFNDAPVTKMDVIARDCAARLRTVANCLECCEWYDESASDVAETRTGIIAVLDEVRAAVLKMFAEEGSESQVEAAAPAAARTKVGRAISSANAKTIRDAHGACTTALGHLDSLVSQLPDDEEDDDGEDVELDEDAELDDDMELE